MGVCQSVADDEDVLTKEEKMELDEEEARREKRRRAINQRVKTKQVKMTKNGQVVGLSDSDEEESVASPNNVQR